MRIAHVVTAVSPDGAFGGPTRVALNEARELMSRGHDVTLFAAGVGWDGPLPSVVDGVEVALFPARRIVPYRGFATLYSADLNRALEERLDGYDAVHIHLARDFVTLPAARAAMRSGVPFVVQTHGMIRATRNPLLRLLDATWTGRVLRAAHAVYALTPVEAQELTSISGSARNVSLLPNGIPELAEPSGAAAYPPRDVEALDILYLARLHERKRPLVFVQAAELLATELPGATFSLVGPDDGQADAVTTAIRRAGLPQLRYEGALPPAETTARVAAADIYVLPAIDEPFGMTVVEAMQLGLPVVVTDSCALAPAIAAVGAGLVADSSVEGLAAAIRALAADPEARARMGEAGRELVRRDYGMSGVVRTLEAAYSVGTP